MNSFAKQNLRDDEHGKLAGAGPHKPLGITCDAEIRAKQADDVKGRLSSNQRAGRSTYMHLLYKLPRITGPPTVFRVGKKLNPCIYVMNFRISHEMLNLFMKLVRHPKVISIKKSDELTLGGYYPRIASVRQTLSRLTDLFDTFKGSGYHACTVN